MLAVTKPASQDLGSSSGRMEPPGIRVQLTVSMLLKARMSDESSA